ncbi:hypothetical protein K438DRAFT_353391 [Mycena galopus ATCC 62051]|nr:hypothetical protein K438DRAFT_353391 [Mycena galopus ATCC 62051]
MYLRQSSQPTLKALGCYLPACFLFLWVASGQFSRILFDSLRPRLRVLHCVLRLSLLPPCQLPQHFHILRLLLRVTITLVTMEHVDISPHCLATSRRKPSLFAVTLSALSPHGHVTTTTSVPPAGLCCKQATCLASAAFSVFSAAFAFEWHNISSLVARNTYLAAWMAADSAAAAAPVSGATPPASTWGAGASSTSACCCNGGSMSAPRLLPPPCPPPTPHFPFPPRPFPRPS